MVLSPPRCVGGLSGHSSGVEMLTPRATRLAHEAQLMSRRWVKFRTGHTAAGHGYGFHGLSRLSVSMKSREAGRGTGEKVAEVTERDAAHGYFRQPASVATLKALARDADSLPRESPLMPWTTQLVLKLEALGWKIAIASAVYLLRRLICVTRLRSTAQVANELEIMDGKFYGHVIGDGCDAEYKANTLLRSGRQESGDIPLAQTQAIGDGANDLPMIKAAGLGTPTPVSQKVNESDGYYDPPR